MSLRAIAKKTKPCDYALVTFPQEVSRAIIKTNLITGSLEEGNDVDVTWEGKNVQARILHLNGKCT